MTHRPNSECVPFGEVYFKSGKHISKILLLVSLIGFSLVVSAQEKRSASVDSGKTVTGPISKTKPLPKLLDLGAKKCIPCKKMAPILIELEHEYRGIFDVEFVDVWQKENVDRAKTHKVSAIPTQIFFDSKGVELWRHIGFLSKSDILQKWEELGYDFSPKPSLSNSASPKPS